VSSNVAVTELFAERGFRQTTWEDIAARAGASRGSIPWHFGNKEGFPAAVVEHVVERLRAGARVLRPGTLDQALHALAAFTRSPSTRFFSTLVGEASEPGSPLCKWYADPHEALRDHVRSWVGQASLPDGVGARELSTVPLGVVGFGDDVTGG
jgi:TetR/AcrR family transcriptional regulator, acrAB operon repressor